MLKFSFLNLKPKHNLLSIVIYSSLLLLFFSACRPSPLVVENCENNPNLKFLINKEYKKNDKVNVGKLILNEGGYTYGNASITAWQLGGNYTQNIFQSKNNYVIGDVLQSSFLKSKNDLYLIVNNSQKIELVDRNSFERKKTIVGFTSPRYMTTYSSYAFVTDLYANAISVFDITTNCEKESIKMKGWTEQIFTINDKLFVIERSEVASETKFANIVTISNVDIENNKYSFNRTKIAIEPQSVIKDKDNNLWILSSGKESKDVFPTLTKFNTTTNTIEKSFTFNSFGNIPQNICTDNNFLYYNQGKDIYRIDVNANNFSNTKLFTSQAENIYNLSFDTHLLYISDAKDYISNGEVLVYEINGNFSETISTGIIPNEIIF